MADEQQFIEDGLQRTQIDEFFAEELGRAGYGGMDVAKTPMGTQIVLKAEKPGMVIGKGGKNIRKLTNTLEERFDLEDPQVDVQEVEEPDLNAQIVADRLANALERGWYFRKAGHTTIDRIMEAGAKGAEIVLSGKVTGARSRVEKFNRGYIKHNGEPAQNIVDHGQGVAVMKLGTIGVDVKIIPPDAELPDDFEIYEDVDVADYVEDVEGETVEELLEGEPEEDEAAAPEAAEETPDVDEEVVEEAPEDFEDVDVPDDDDVEEELDELEEAVDEELDEETEAEAEELLDEMDDEPADADDESASADTDEEDEQ
ncbi:30S ribosomal protein S3 [Halapricum hydrolyticum]|uniref:Small ribosomal subunit protein uS3 n=1 Tax=Halapricum hydrolyticum TaxID=2979991 RepID=A0AAE3IBN6_9EURY|nr:30S ribosomal protein S3 [Halapricum hydrolyticum]MCU4717351.1 30S ribosomal protein S3 [Halapricum hydrolyticum]MCU4726278.1 30S ribosomal protein S3 [Halapricum hydrolyticum]